MFKEFLNIRAIINRMEDFTAKAPIVEALENALDKCSYHFHIPGHARGNGVFEPFRTLVGDKFFQCDMTDEFDGIGTLNPPTGPIKEAQELCAKLFDAKKSFFLLNGSTIGNLAIAMGLTSKKQKVIVNRNCHRSVLTGLIMSGAEPIWINPETLDEWGLWGKISPAKIEDILKRNNDVGMVWITNPTYEGVVSDIETIAKICKKYGVFLVVDEAHGTLWKFNENMPVPALEYGADIVVQSFHKTGGSMSQTSVMHVGKNSDVDIEALQHSLKLLHSTSPSIILLAGLDAARANLETKTGLENIQNAIDNANYLIEEIDKLENISHLKQEVMDVTKIFIKADNLSGIQLETVLEEDYNIEIEAASDKGLLLLSNIGNSREEFEYLAKCLKEVDKTDYSSRFKPETQKHMPMLTPIIQMRLRDAFYAEKEEISTKYAVGRLSGQVVAECPPGIAILLPGELITKQHLPYLENYDTIEVIK